MMLNPRRSAAVALILLTAGCPPRVPVKKNAPPPMTMPAATMPAEATTMPVATADLGGVGKTPGLFPGKPFVKLPDHFGARGNPSTLLLEHAWDSPIPLSEFGNQPVRTLEDFHLHEGMTADEVKQKFGEPAQMADVEERWMVYRLTGTRELWLHFQPVDHGRLVAADVVRGVESGYVRTHVFTAN